MGIKHLRKIEELFRKNKTKSYTRTDIRNIIKTNYWSIIDAISYLIEEKKIIAFEGDNGHERYKWNQVQKN